MQTYKHHESGAMLSIDTADDPTQEQIIARLEKALMEFNLNQEQEKNTFAHKAWDATKAVAKDVGKGVVNAPTNVASGIFKALDGTKNLLDDATGGNYSKVMDKITSYTPLANKGYYIEDGNIYYVDDVQKRIENVDDLQVIKKAPDSVTGSLTEGISQLATSFALLRSGRISAIGKSSNKYTERALTFAEASAAPNLAFDPYEFRLANFFEDYMADNHPWFESPEWLQWLSVEEDDGVALARFKMLLEDTGVEAVALGVLAPMAIAYKNMKKGKPYNDQIDKVIDDYYKNKGVSILNMDKQVKAVETDLAFKEEIKKINSLDVPTKEKQRLKNEARAKRIDKTDPEFLGDGGKVYKQEDTFKRADELYATIFHDTLDVEEALDRLKALQTESKTNRDFIRDDEFVTVLYRTHQNAHREVLKATRNVESEQRVYEDAIKEIDARNDIDQASKEILRQKAKKEYTEAEAIFHGSHDNYVKSMAAFYDKSHEIGAALNMHKEFSSFADGTTAFKARQTFSEMMQRLDEKERATFSLGFIKHVQRGAVWTMRALDELFINSILAGFKTGIINVGTNTSMLFANIFENLLASGFRSTFLRDPKGGKEHAINTIGVAIGNARAIRESVSLGLKAYQKGHTFIDSNTTVEGAYKTVIGNDLSFDIQTLKRLTPLWRDKGDKATFADYLGLIGSPLRAISTRALSAEDEMFKNISFRGKVFGDAFSNYLKRNLDEGMSAKVAFAKSMQQADAMVERTINYQIHKNNSKRDGTIYVSNDPEAVALSKTAMQKARELTFTNDLDHGWEHLQKTVAAIPLARQVSPFVRTPMNLVSAAIQRSPIAPLSGRWWDDFMSGNPERKSQALARWSIGAGILTYIMTAPEDWPFSAASLRGASPDTWQQARNEQELAGAVHGSVKWWDKENQISRIDPIFTPFEGIATIMELHKSGKTEEADELFSMYALALGKMISNDTYGTGVRQIVNAINEPTGNAWKKLYNNRVAQIGRPWSALQRASNQVNDPFMREVRNLEDAFAINTRGKSQNAPPRYNILFERVPRTTYATTGLFGDNEDIQRFQELASPVITGQAKDDDIAVEVHKQNISVAKPSPYLKNGKIDLLSDALNVHPNGERVYQVKRATFKRYTAYDRWNDLASTIKRPNPLNPEGKEVNLREALKLVINSKAYKDILTDNIKIETKIGRKKVTLFNGSRKRFLTDIISDYRNDAKDKMIAENPYIQKAILEVKTNEALSQTQETQPNMILNQPLLGAGN